MTDETIDYSEDAAGRNMYGCTPCPKCKSVFRHGRHIEGALFVECSDCGVVVPARDVTEDER